MLRPSLLTVMFHRFQTLCCFKAFRVFDGRIGQWIEQEMRVSVGDDWILTQATRSKVNLRGRDQNHYTISVLLFSLCA